MEYLDNIEKLSIGKLYLSDKFELFVSFKGINNKEICFIGIENVCINKYHKDIEYDFYIDNIINKKVSINDYELINKVFPINYDKKYYLNNIVDKFSILLIEGDIVIYLMYEKHLI